MGSNPIPPDMKFEWYWGQRLGREECIYARRWVVGMGLFSIRVHHFYHSDDPRFKHDHPWWYLTFVFRGGYWDRGVGYDRLLKAPTIAFRKAESAHWVDPLPGGVWTLVITGRHKRTWGFWVKGKFKKAYRYFFDYGHPPCE